MITIRDARPDDLAPLAQAVARQPLLLRYGTTAAALAQSLEGALARGEEVLLACEGDEPRAMAWFLRGGTFALGGYLRLIATLPGSESRGLGSLLLDEVERRTREKSRFLFLLVSAHNEAAQRFYERRGYARAGRLDALLRPDIDELIFWKRL